MGRNRSGKIKHLLISTTKSLFESGFNKSKYEAFQESYLRDRTRQSPNIHSFSTYVSYEKTVAKFSDFLKENGLKYERDFKKLTPQELYEYVDKFFEKEKQEGLAKKTLERHVSALYKVLGTVEPKVRQFFTPDNRGSGGMG